MSNEFFFSPENSILYKKRIDDIVFKHKIENSYFIASSGTTSKGFIKIFVFKKEKLLGHADYINSRFEINKNSKILNVLPTIFMGGLSLLLRANVANCDYNEIKWNPSEFYKNLNTFRPTHISLVPTQLRRIVDHEIIPNKELEVCFVGGARLGSELKVKALDLGWPIFETYGQTEHASQLSTVKSNYEETIFSFFEFVQIENRNQEFYINTPFSFDYLIEIAEFSEKIIVKKDEDLIPLNDSLCFLSEKTFKINGRIDEFIKVKGQLVNLQFVENEINHHFGINPQDFYLLKVDSLDEDDKIMMVSKEKINIDKIKNLLGYRIQELILVNKFSYTHSGKIKKVNPLES